MFGKIYIKNINKDEIIFESVLYDSNGNYVQEKLFQILNGCEIEVDNDGVMDLRYSEPTRKHAKYENSVFNFFEQS